MGSQGGRVTRSPLSSTATSSLGARVFGTTTWYTNLAGVGRGHKVGDVNGMHVLLEPPISHHKEALISTVLAPRILNLITQRLSVLGIEVNARDDHCMGHRRLVGS